MKRLAVPKPAVQLLLSERKKKKKKNEEQKQLFAKHFLKELQI